MPSQSSTGRPMFQLNLVYFNLLGVALAAQSALSPSQKCTDLKRFRLDNAIILDATHVSAGSNVTTPTGACQSTATVSTAVCRVQVNVTTSSSSSVRFEAWLPDEDQWFGRFLGLGNGGLNGCIDYENLDYGSSMHFASVGSNNGHDGGDADGTPFLNHPEVLDDFAFRAIHVEAILGKQIVEEYYSKAISKSYYLGCSTGGRQAIKSALMFPEDFDGLVAGSPATNFYSLSGAQALLGQFVGAPHANSSPAFIPADLWPVISQEIFSQCDDLDGIVDGIISDPDLCIFRPEALLCDVDAASTGANTTCLTPSQVGALKKIYQPIFGNFGQLIYPRYDPGAESDGNFVNMFSGEIFSIAAATVQDLIFNNPNFSFDNFSVADIELANDINPGDLATFDGNLSAFNARGGKIVSYHGGQDQLIPSGSSPRLYNLISLTLSLPNLDSFYRLFRIPGMEHCSGGPGAWAFGQGGISSNLVNSSSHNILLALVDWVEGDQAPPDIIGSVPGPDGPTAERTHCRYPQRSMFNGSTFVCEVIN